MTSKTLFPHPLVTRLVAHWICSIGFLTFKQMSKGFAVSEGLFSRVWVVASECGFIGVSDLSRVGVFTTFGNVSTGSDP